MHKIIGNPEDYEHLEVLKKLIKQYVPYAQKEMGFDKPVDINLLSDPKNAQNPLGKTAFYEPGAMKISLFVTGRHPKDIMRSLSHEMVHHTQNCKGNFKSGINTGPGYAQEDEHLRDQEKQAYLMGNLRFRDWEDGIKQQQEHKKMKNKNLIKEIAKLIQQEVQNLEKNKGVQKTNEISPIGVGPAITREANFGEGQKHDCDKVHSDVSHEEWKEKQEKLAEQEETNENWLKGRKDQILFEELTKKWTKKR
tara:strand:+ start:412 stop:1164 length:753 start_codon:yes stop_codon:yes gene_type:complete